MKKGARAAFVETLGTNPFFGVVRACVVGHFGIPKLANETEGTITIDWANTFYVNGQGYKYHVAHQGVPLWSPVSMLQPTQVGPGQTIEDDLQPARELKRDGQWLLAPLTDPQIAQGDFPNRLTVLMPIRSNGVVKVHRFDMEVDEIDPLDTWGPWLY